MKSNRRNFLKGSIASSLALSPLILNAQDTDSVEKSDSPKRIIFICNSLGFYAPNLLPKTAGDLGTSDYLKQIKTVNKMTLFENLYHPGMKTSNHDSEKSFLTGGMFPESSTFKNTISVDQLLARKLGTETRFPYLNLAISDRGWGSSWNEMGSPIPPLHDEQLVFNRLFGKEDQHAVELQLQKDQAIIECLRRDISFLKRQDADPSSLNAYLTNLDHLEAQFERQMYWLNKAKPQINHSLSKDTQFPFSTKLKNLLDLSRLAFQTDSTRVITLSLEFIEGAIKVPGVTGSWHSFSHHANKKNLLTSLEHIEQNILKHLNQFLFDMDQIKEGDRSLLDNTTVVIGSNFGDASNHTHNNLPIIIAGGGYKHDSHRVLEGPTPLCNLYLELLNKHDIDMGKFGSSKKNMALLKS
ncbi:MAG: hypothetical protein COA78_03230 [Blastopirellula sp.]|nr:MAG: hypothetical protein COA78_03230 [Blastopirellula sp.]